MSSPAKDILDYLVSNDIGEPGYDIFYHNGPSGTTNQITVRDTGGIDPELCLEPSNQIKQPTVQVYLRGKKYKFADVYTKAEQIVALIDQQTNLIINSNRYVTIKIMGNILDMGEDTNECPELSINFVLRRA